MGGLPSLSLTTEGSRKEGRQTSRQPTNASTPYVGQQCVSRSQPLPRSHLKECGHTVRNFLGPTGYMRAYAYSIRNNNQILHDVGIILTWLNHPLHWQFYVTRKPTRDLFAVASLLVLCTATTLNCVPEHVYSVARIRVCKYLEIILYQSVKFFAFCAVPSGVSEKIRLHRRGKCGSTCPTYAAGCQAFPAICRAQSYR